MDNFNFYKVVEKLKKKYSKEFITDLENFQLNEKDIEKNLKKIKVNWIRSSGFKIANPFYIGRVNIEGLDYEISMEKGNKKIRFKRLKKINH
jgi:glucokinase